MLRRPLLPQMYPSPAISSDLFLPLTTTIILPNMAPRTPSKELLALLRRVTRPSIATPLRPSTCQLSNRPRYIATHTHPHQAAAISVLQTAVDKNSAEFKENEAQMKELLVGMSELHAKISLGGNQKARDKHIARGKMLPRESVFSY